MHLSNGMVAQGNIQLYRFSATVVYVSTQQLHYVFDRLNPDSCAAHNNASMLCDGPENLRIVKDGGCLEELVGNGHTVYSLR